MIDSKFTKLLLFFTLHNHASEFALSHLITPPYMRLPPAIYTTPEADLIATNYQPLIDQTDTHQTLQSMRDLESRNLLYLSIAHLESMKKRLTDHRPAQHDEFYYFFGIIAARIELNQKKKKKALELQLNTALVEHALSEEYLNGIVSTFLRHFLNPPRYQTPEEQDNLIKERSCAICQTPISEIPESATNIRVVSIVAPCNHFFCDSCHTQWESTPEYQSRCPLCRKREDKIYQFRIRSDTSSHT